MTNEEGLWWWHQVVLPVNEGQADDIGGNDDEHADEVEDWEPSGMEKRDLLMLFLWNFLFLLFFAYLDKFLKLE